MTDPLGRRGWSRGEIVSVIVLLIQIALFAFSAGRLQQQVDDINFRLTRIELWLDRGDGNPR